MALEKYLGRELSYYDKFELWLISGRHFTLPMLFAFTFFAIVVAEGTLMDWVWTTLIIGTLWTASHYFNNYFDWRSGIDRISGGSIAKSYSASPLVLPYKLLSPTTVIVSAWAFVILSGIFLFISAAPLRIYPFWVIGAFCAIFYTTVFKTRKIGVICVWLSFFSLGCAAYFFVNPYNMNGVMVGFFPAIMIFTMWTFNQIADENAPIEKAKGLIEKFVKGGTKQSSFFWFSVCSIFIIQFSAALLGWLPEGIMLSIFALPIAHLAGITIDYEEKGAILVILWITLHTFFMGLGAIYL